eukprot:8769083-Pyramimonas_sp.AAC.1
MKNSSGMGTLLMEGAFQRQRRLETEGSNNQGRPQRLLATLLDKSVIQEVHHYTPLPVDEKILTRGVVPSQSWFTAPDGLWEGLDEIVGFNRTPDWSNVSQERHCVPYCDMDLVDFINREAHDLQ